MIKLKKILCSLLVVVMVLMSVPISESVLKLPQLGIGAKASAANYLDASGQCGDNVYWTFDSDTGELVISGEGEMWENTSFCPPFRNNSSIKAVVIEDGVTNIGDYTFYNCESLESVSIPNSVTSIGDYAFYICEKLASIELPNKIINLGVHAFVGTAYTNDDNNWEDGVLYIGKHLVKTQSEITSCDIKDGTINIANHAFSYRKKLTKLTIPNSITTIPKEAFEYCTSLKEITIPNTVTEIGESAFEQSGLTSINIPYGVKSIGTSAFENCSSLANITIAESVTNIGKYAFYKTAYWNNKNNWTEYGKTDSHSSYFDVLYIDKYLISAWSNITSVDSIVIKEGTVCICDDAFSCAGRDTKTLVIPNTVRNIGEAAFYRCRNVESVIIPSSVETIGAGAFAACESLLKIIVDENNANYSSDSDGVLFNKNKTELIQFPGKSEKTVYTIPETVTKIGITAFAGCNIVNVIIPDSVKKMGKGAFSECYYLENVSIGSSISIIPEMAFSNSSLHDIKIPDSVIRIDEKAFTDCFFLENIVLGNSIRKIGDHAFEGTAIKSITLPDSVTEIGQYAFCGCSSIESINIGKGLTYIGFLTFAQCSLKKIVIPSNVIFISDLAFYYSVSLNEIELTDGLEAIGAKAFAGTAIENITIPGTVTYISDGAFADCETLKSITFSEGITETQYMGVGSKSEVTYVSLPETLEKIGYCSFVDFSFKALRIPHNVTEICEGAFADCDDLTDVYYDGTEDEWYKIDIIKRFNDPLLNATIHFKDGTTHTHSFTSSVTKEPTHTEEGVTTYTCKCGKVYTEAIAKLQTHTYTSEITRYPTHTNVGKMTYTCACGDTYTQDIAKTEGHTYNYRSRYVEPTCTSEGYTIYYCACGDNYTANTVPALGHSDNDSNGYCDRCGDELARNCSCNCHKSGFIGILWKIQRLFYKLFRTNQYCSCGAEHY